MSNDLGIALAEVLRGFTHDGGFCCDPGEEADAAKLIVEILRKEHGTWVRETPQIAAAPDLLEALKGLLHPYGGVVGTQERIANALAAIAKAEGKLE